MKEEKLHIQGALKRCGYPKWAFGRAHVRKANKDKVVSKGDNKDSTIITIPYVSELSEKLKKTFKEFDIYVCFKPCNTIRQRLVHPKDKQNKNKKCELVYGIKCKDCPASYIGETKQALISRLKQHRRPSTNEVQESAVYNHIQAAGHQFEDRDVLILDKEDKWFERGVKEAIYEHIERPSLNKRRGLCFSLSRSWDQILRGQPCRLSHDRSKSQSAEG